MGSFEEIKAKGTKVTDKDLEALDIKALWKAAEYYAKWAAEDPGFIRLQKVLKMIQMELDKRYEAQDERRRRLYEEAFRKDG